MSHDTENKQLKIEENSHIFASIILTGNRMIFLVQFGDKRAFINFSKTTKNTRLTDSCNLFVFEKFIRAVLS